MAVVWRNNGEKDGEGQYIVDVDPENGTQVQTFSGRSRKDVAEQLATAQFNASRTIHQMKEERTPDRRGDVAKIVPIPLSAEERMRLSIDLQDPSKADDAIERLVESKVGSLKAIADRENDRIQKEQDEREMAETRKWLARTPDWYPSGNNKAAVFNYIENNKLDVTAKNLEIAWDDLKQSGAAEFAPPKPAGEEEVVLDTRPRIASYSTGVREDEISRPAPAEGRKKTKWSWAETDAMGSAGYKQMYNSSAEFRKAMDERGPRP